MTPTERIDALDRELPGYAAYHRRVVAAIRDRLFARWPPKTGDDCWTLAINVAWFDEQCTFDENFKRGEEPADFVDDEIDAAS